jgi:hypothetical protein
MTLTLGLAHVKGIAPNVTMHHTLCKLPPCGLANWARTFVRGTDAIAVAYGAENRMSEDNDGQETKHLGSLIIFSLG